MSAEPVQDILADEVFDRIFEEPDVIKRANLLNELRVKAKAEKRVREFDAKQAAYSAALREQLKAERDKAKEEKAQAREAQRRRLEEASNVTCFTGLTEIGRGNLNCGPWLANDGGVSIFDQQRSSITACPHPILPVERLRNIQTGKEKIVLAFKRDRQWTEQTFRKDLISSANKIVELSNYGILVTSENARALVKYLSDVEARNMEDIELRESSSKFGWINGRFLPYDSGGIEFDADTDFPQLASAITENGSYRTWLNHILDLREQGSFHVRVMMAASFASVLLKKLGALPYIIDLWGGTEAGKSVAELVACSIWADPGANKYIGDFKSTETALEARADALNNLPLILDDTAKTSKRIKDNFEGFVYDITSGKGKSRSDRSLGLQQEKTWQLVTITTGETPINGFVQQGGAINRILELHVDDKLFKDPRKTADLVRENYGFAGRLFTQVITTIDPEELLKDYNGIIDEITEVAGEAMQKQALSLATILLADRIATDYIFFDGLYIAPKESLCMLSNPDDVNGNKRCYQYIVDEIFMNQSRFDPDVNTEQWGILDTDKGIAYLFPAALQNLCENGHFSKSSFISYCLKEGLMLPDKEGRPQRNKKIGRRAARMYWLKMPENPEFIEVEADDGTALPLP